MTNLGPLVTASHRARVMNYITRGKSEGARLEFGGNSPDLPGAYVNPTLFTGVSNRMTIAQEEIFGPVAATIEVDGIAEALSGGERFDLRSGRVGVDARPLGGPQDRAGSRGGCDLGELFRSRRHDATVRRLQAIGPSRDKCLESLLSYTQTKSAWINLG